MRKSRSFGILWLPRFAGHEQVERIGLQNKKTGEKTELPVDGVFVAVGNIPNSKIVTELFTIG